MHKVQKEATMPKTESQLDRIENDLKELKEKTAGDVNYLQGRV